VYLLFSPFFKKVQLKHSTAFSKRNLSRINVSMGFLKAKAPTMIGVAIFAILQLWTQFLLSALISARVLKLEKVIFLFRKRQQT